jgi:hypothetical protein
MAGVRVLHVRHPSEAHQPERVVQYHKNDVELVRGIEADEEKNHKVVLLDSGSFVQAKSSQRTCIVGWKRGGGAIDLCYRRCRGIATQGKAGGEESRYVEYGDDDIYAPICQVTLDGIDL